MTLSKRGSARINVACRIGLKCEQLGVNWHSKTKCLVYRSYKLYLEKGKNLLKNWVRDLNANLAISEGEEYTTRSCHR